MKFEDFISEGKVLKGEPDQEKAKSLLKMSKNNLSVVENIAIDSNSSSLVLATAYESLRQVLEAITLSKGLKVFSHEAYTSYLSDLGELTSSSKFDRLRKLRNGVNYYGKPISENVAIQALIDIKELCKYLEKKYLANLK